MSIYDRIALICSTLGQLAAVFVPLFFIISGLEILSEKLTGRLMQFDFAAWVEEKTKQIDAKRREHDEDVSGDS